jgi:phage baseplate assembly protein W
MSTWIDVNSNYAPGNTAPELALDLVAVNNSIENILSTPIGSRPMQRDYGSQLYYFLMEPIDAKTEEDIRVSIIQALAKWEPRILIDKKQTSVTKLLDNSGYDVQVFYQLIVPTANGSVQFTAKSIQ